MDSHSGRIIFTCGICEFEATRKSLLEKHHESKHKKRKENIQNPQKCNTCEKIFLEDIFFKYHSCSPDSKFVCQLCKFRAISLFELLTHMENHREKIFSCSQCEFKVQDECDLKQHVVTNHKQTLLACSFCDFKAEGESCLGDHVLTHHGDSAIITIVGNQQILMNDALFAFQQNTESLLQSLLQGQNYMKSEILLLREELAELKEKGEAKEKI